MPTPLVYLVLGSKASGQFRVVADLIEFGATKDERAVVYCSTNDKPDAEADLAVKTREASLARYDWSGGALRLEIEGEPELVFVVADGLADPADFAEAFHAWLQGSGCELGRVLTVLDCELVANHPQAMPWFDCCIHFSDVVLLAKREGMTNRQVQDFLHRYEEERYPCLFERVKKGRVANPALVLAPQPRRISRIFDEPEIFEDDDETDIEEEQVAGDPSKDRYLRRGAGDRRQMHLPSIQDVIGS